MMCATWYHTTHHLVSHYTPPIHTLQQTSTAVLMCLVCTCITRTHLSLTLQQQTSTAVLMCLVMGYMVARIDWPAERAAACARLHHVDHHVDHHWDRVGGEDET